MPPPSPPRHARPAALEAAAAAPPPLRPAPPPLRPAPPPLRPAPPPLRPAPPAAAILSLAFLAAAAGAGAAWAAVEHPGQVPLVAVLLCTLFAAFLAADPDGRCACALVVLGAAAGVSIAGPIAPAGSIGTGAALVAIGLAGSARARRSAGLVAELERARSEAADHGWALMETALAADEAASDLEEDAQTDHLTGLANRAGFDRAVRMRPWDSSYAVLAIDLDGFKAVNDSHGHEAGDRTLVLVADVIRSATRAIDVQARMGGDEFSAVLFYADADQGARTAARILAGLAEARSAGRTSVAASIGVAAGAPEEDVSSAYRRADQAMYAAKGAGKNCWRVMHVDGAISGPPPAPFGAAV